MADKNFFDDLAQQIARLIPAASALGNDVKNNISAALQSGFQKMDLVTREEFDAQVQSLHRAQVRLEAMEAIIAELELQIHKSKTRNDQPDTPGT